MMLHQAAHAAMVLGNKQVVVVKQVNRCGIGMSCAAEDLYKAVKQTMKPVFLVHDILFQRRPGAIKNSGDDLYLRVQAFIWESPYSSLYIAEISKL